MLIQSAAAGMLSPSRNSFLFTFLCVLPFLLYSLSTTRTSQHCPRCTRNASPNGATAKWAVLHPTIPSAPTGLSVALDTPINEMSGVRRGSINNPGPPRPPRPVGLPLPRIASMDLWGGETSPMYPLLGTCWLMRSEAPPPKDSGPDYPDYFYEFCMGDRLKQVPHPYTENRVVMGVFSGWGDEPSGGGFVQNYLNGTLCEGWGRRETIVHFICDEESVSSPRIISVEEPDVCKYKMTLATEHACVKTG